VTLLDAAGSSGEQDRASAIEEALLLINRFDPRRLDRLRRDLYRIIIIKEGGSRLSYGAHIGTIDAAQISNQPPATLATTLVELASRARLIRRFPDHQFSEAATARIFHRAIREQIAFVRALPAGEFTGTDAMLEYLEDAAQKYICRARVPAA
jgi:hypothetical protein